MKLILLLIILSLSVQVFAKSPNLWKLDSITIDDYSPIMNLTGHRIENVFSDNTGKLFSSDGLIIFEYEPAAVHYIEWHTEKPVDIGYVEICANCDIPSTMRKAGGFILYGKKNAADSWTEYYSWTPPKGIYRFEKTAEHMVKSDTVSAKGYRYFRCEVTENEEESPGASPILFGLRAYSESPVQKAAPVHKQDKYVTYLLHDQGLTGFAGMQNFINGLKERGTYDKVKLTILLNGSEAETQPDSKAFWQELYKDGHEIACEKAEGIPHLASWLEIDPKEFTTVGADLFGDCDMYREPGQIKAGITAEVNACPEGNSLAEFWDIPHNWEGAPIMPYYVQWDEDNPLSTARVNRELDKDRAVLELSWGTRTPWHNYDRFPIPQVWHVGEPSKPAQHRVGQLVREDTKGGWWNCELNELEKNLAAGRTPFLYLSVTIETCWFAPEVITGAKWDECLYNGLDLVDMFLRNNWQIVTCKDFTKWYADRWPCPQCPSMIYLLEDTLANREDRDGLVINGNGHIVHAETQYFQITDSDNRLNPEIVIAYGCKTPNLLRGGYTFADPGKYPGIETQTGHYASTTGNAIFWSPSEPLKDLNGEEYFRSYKESECSERAFTFYLGDNYKDYMFVPSEFSKVRRTDNEVTWTKEMINPAPDTDIRVAYTHTLKGPQHIVDITVTGKDAEQLNAKFRLCPYFHQGWDLAAETEAADSRIPDWKTAGQERNVFAKIGKDTFAWQEDNAEEITRSVTRKKGFSLDIYNHNPGTGSTVDDNPLMNRGFTLISRQGGTVTFKDQKGANEYVTAEIDFGRHKKGRTYRLIFEYWNEKDR